MSDKSIKKESKSELLKQVNFVKTKIKQKTIIPK